MAAVAISISSSTSCGDHHFDELLNEFRCKDASACGTVLLSDCCLLLKKFAASPTDSSVYSLVEHSGAAKVAYGELVQWLRENAGSFESHEDQYPNQVLGNAAQINQMKKNPGALCGNRADAQSETYLSETSDFSCNYASERQYSNQLPPAEKLRESSPVYRVDLLQDSFLSTESCSKTKSVVQAAGHQDSLQQEIDDDRYILKPYDDAEREHYEKVWSCNSEAELQKYIGGYHGVAYVEDTKCIKLTNLLRGHRSPCVMDCKLGLRTFKEEEVKNNKPRADLYQKLLKMDPEAPTEEETASKTCTKCKYLSTRDSVSSSTSLGMRIEGVASMEGVRVDQEDLKTLQGDDNVLQTLMLVLPVPVPGNTECTRRMRLVLVRQIVEQLEGLLDAVVKSGFIRTHELIGTSCLFVVSREKASLHLIDFAKTSALEDGVSIDHRSTWQRGNHEDGFILGIENLLRLWKKVLTALEDGDDVVQKAIFQKAEQADQVGRLAACLERFGIDTSGFGKNGARSVEELAWELNVSKDSALEIVSRGRCRRTVEVVRAWILADIHGALHTLMDAKHFCPFTTKVHAGETWMQALQHSLLDRLNIPLDKQANWLSFDRSTYLYSSADIDTSEEVYPGLETLYRVHEIDVIVKCPGQSELASIGLPDGRSFTGVFRLTMLGSEVHYWKWSPTENTAYFRRGVIEGRAPYKGGS